MASVVINDTLGNPFQQTMRFYANPDLFRADREPSTTQVDSLLQALSEYEYVIASVHNTSTKAASGYGISDAISGLLAKLAAKTRLVLVVFGNAYTLSRLGDPLLPEAIVLSYEDTGWPQHYTAQALFGGTAATGRLPVTPGNGIAPGTGIRLDGPLSRLRFGHPLDQGISKVMFHKVDSLARSAIRAGATPGCQVLATWNGEVIYRQSFGNFTYDSAATPVSDTSLYDLASITKIAATALALMKLHESGEINIGRKASRYFHALRKTNKKDLLIRDILTHSAGLEPWIPFWKETMEHGNPSFNIYHHERDVNYNVQVADSLFMLGTYKEKIWQRIFDSKVGEPGNYVYSDIGMLIMQRVVEEVTGKPLDVYLEEEFYEPLGLHRLLFNPIGKVPGAGIVPTETDTAFRKTLVRGFVHDPAAAMLGGVSGHAGLFGDATSVAVILQLLLNGGTYGGRQYLKPETVALFTSRFNMTGKNRRGLVFDKPDPSLGRNGPTAVSATPFTFGHTGFTGTAAWADPGNKLIFVFLSNRVHPFAANNLLSQGNYRTEIMEAFYEVLRKTKSPDR
jgi:CubicO group peptidase (beta-lactamase class C family)